MAITTADVIASLTGTIILNGRLLGLTELAIPVGTVENVDVSPTAAIAASKLQRGPVITDRQHGTAVDETIITLFCKGATGTIRSFTVSNLTACAGSSVVNVDLKKNGTTVLSAVVELSSADAAYSESEGTITVPGMVDGDYLTVVITTVVSGTDALAADIFWQIEFDEDRS